MCTGILRIDPGSAWPVLLAFVRDEDRGRPTLAPARHWPDTPSRMGGRDERAGGTWLAVEDGPAPRLAFIQNRRDVISPIDPAERISRGTIPGRALDEHGLELSADELRRLDPFVLVLAGVDEPPRWWNWDGVTLETGSVEPGWHMVTSHGIDREDLSARHRTWLPRFAAAAEPAIDLAHASTRESWGPWIELLDGRGAVMGDDTALVIAGVEEHPAFGTVGGTLLALAPDAVRYDINTAQDLDPGAWSRVELAVLDPLPNG